MNTLINGVPCDTISVNDRGLLYGDGVFRTMLFRDGKISLWHRHYARLLKDCNTIDLPCPAESLLQEDLALLDSSDGVIKIIVTRGVAQRGYAAPRSPATTRILTLSPHACFPESFSNSGVRLHLCKTRLGHQPRLAGVKHLNRLENVLAAGEWDDPDIAEGLLLDESGYVIEGTRSNIFMVKDSALITPDLSRCGVSGVQRERIVEWAKLQGIVCKSRNISLDSLLEADEIFIVNSVIGLWPVREILGYHREHHPFSKTLQDWLNHEPN